LITGKFWFNLVMHVMNFFFFKHCPFAAGCSS
jgi:hypothetical protein